MQADSKIYVAGHCGLVGSAIMRRLATKGFSHSVACSHAELDLTDNAATETRYEQLLGSDESVTGRFEPPLINVGVGEDVTRLNGMGWKAPTTLETGLRAAYADHVRQPRT